MNDIVDTIDSILSVEGLMLEAEKELRTETEFLKNKKKEESEAFKIKELNLQTIQTGFSLDARVLRSINTKT